MINNQVFELLLFQTSQDKKTNFLKVHAPWEILARYTDILNLRRPVKVKSIFIKEFKSNIREHFAFVVIRSSTAYHNLFIKDDGNENSGWFGRAANFP